MNTFHMVRNIGVYTWIEQTPIHLQSKTGWVHIPSIWQYPQPHSNKGSRQGDVRYAVSGCRKVEQLQGREMYSNGSAIYHIEPDLHVDPQIPVG